METFDLRVRQPLRSAKKARTRAQCGLTPRETRMRRMREEGRGKREEGKVGDEDGKKEGGEGE